MKTSEQRQWRRSGVFIVNFELIFSSVFFFADFEQVMFAGIPLCFNILQYFERFG